ncbi:hypothetical protein RMATCC62417_04710 [Rhizopus microsporus]|nr:hypothetical protein RMATCC62417_04710 [Rhizopus microsporus]CEI96642.1 hypothetical protein RMCBS344292_10799 [Rhizopus microsporus]
MDSEKQYLDLTLSNDRDHLLQTLDSMLEFNIIVEHTTLHINQCHRLIQEIQDAYTIIYQQSIHQKQVSCRKVLTRDVQAAEKFLHSIRCAVQSLEPSKPWLSDLDVRNRKFKHLIQSYKTLIEMYMAIVLDNQRRFSLFFEEQIKQIQPAIDIEQVFQSTSPPLPVQILLQRGERTNDERIQQWMSTVQDIHKDLQVLANTCKVLSELRNELNIIFERYRRRWPLILHEGDFVYVIGDNLDLIEKVPVGLLHKKNCNYKLIVILVIVVILIVFFCVEIILLTS